MATSSTSTFELTRDQLVRRSLQIAGLLEASQSPTGDDISLAADIMQMEIASLVAEGIVVTWVERTTLSLTAAVASATFPTDTLDVAVDPNGVVGTIVPSAGAETPVRVITRQEYLLLPDKTTQATPTQVLIERLATVTATFWPVPVASVSFRYGKIRFPRDMDTGARTLDLSRRWQKAICYSVAFQLALAKSLPLDRASFLRTEAELAKMKALQSDGERGPQQIYVGRYR